MADNTQLNDNTSTGDLLATDDCAGVKYERVKLTDGTANSTTVVAVDVGVKANALRVAPANDITDGTYIGDIKFGEALPAGTAAIGKLAANSGVDIGDVDILSHPSDTFVADDGAYGKGVLIQGDDGTDRRSILVGTDGHVQVDVLSGGGGTEYTEDVATPATITGIAAMMERDDTIGTLTPAEADWAGMRCSAEGALWVQDFNSDTIAGDTTSIDGKITACDTGAVVVASGAITETNSAALAVVGGGAEATALRVTIADDSTGLVSVDDNASSLTVDTTGTSGLEVVQVTAADLNVTEASASAIKTAVELLDNAVYVDDADWTDNTSSHILVGGIYQSSDHTVTDGDVSPLQLDANGCIVLGTSAKAIGKLAANTGVDIGDVTVNNTLDQGNSDAGTIRVAIADDDTLLTTIDADTGAIKLAVETADNVVAVLGTATYAEATTSGTVVGAVRNDDLATLANTDNEIAPLQVDPEGALYVNAAAAEPKRASGVAAGGAPGTDNIVAAVASRYIRVLALGIFATSATVNNIFLDNADNDLMFNTANPLLLSLDADADTVPGFVLQFNPGGWFQTDTVNEAITLNTSAAVDVAWTITYIEVA